MEDGSDAFRGDLVVEGVPHAPPKVVDDAKELFLVAQAEGVEVVLDCNEGVVSAPELTKRAWIARHF